MNNSTLKIQGILQNETTFNQIQSTVDPISDAIIQEISLRDMYDLLQETRSTLLESIKRGILDELTFTQRNKILTRVQQIQQYAQNTNNLVPAALNLSDIVDSLNLATRVSKSLDTKTVSKELTALRSQYKRALANIKKTEEYQSAAEKYFENIESVVKGIEVLDVEQKLKTIKLQSDEINTKRDEIIAFSNNVASTQKIITNIATNLDKGVNEILNRKIEKADILIAQAEKALELKETEGIAAAISARLTKLRESKSPLYWLLGAIAFVVFTMFFAFLLSGGRLWQIKFADDPSAGILIGRAIVTLIGISAATFCAKQYTKLKNLEEDYEYKVVLTKSILAFANKIQELDSADGTKLAEYLTKVLDEIHKDPLRDRRKDHEDNTSIEILKEVAKLITQIKQISN